MPVVVLSAVPSVLNVHRSLREAVAVALGSPPWVVRLADEIPQAPVQRPVAYVEQSAAARILQARGSLPQAAVQRTASFAVTAYVPLGATPRASAIEADKVVGVLDAMICTGVPIAAAPATPLHLPIFDWSSISLEGAAAARALPETAEPLAWADVPLGWSVQPIADPEDPRRFTVALDLQLEWWDVGAPVPLTPEAEGFLGGSFAP